MRWVLIATILDIVNSLSFVSFRYTFPCPIPMSLNANPTAQLGQIKFITYNIDGLNPTALQYRTNIILGLIISEDADIIQLQEVVLETAPVLIKALTASGYSSFHQNDDFARMCHYFTLTFAKTSKIQGAQVSRIPYYGTAASQQGRDLLLLRLSYGNMPWLFANCHLESCGAAFKSAGSTIRQAQLSEGLALIEQHASRGPAILAGDLNIREPEASKVMQSFAGSIVDASAELEKGRKSNTWYMPGPSAYSARYDRVYSNRACKLAPLAIKLIGGDDIYLDMLPTRVQSEAELPYRTPSDHRGIVMTYAFTAAAGGNAQSLTTSTVGTHQPLVKQQPQQLTSRDNSSAEWQDQPTICSRGKDSVSGIGSTPTTSGTSISSGATASHHSNTSSSSSSSSGSSSSSSGSNRKRNSTHMNGSVNSDVTDLTGASTKPNSRTTGSSQEVEVIVIDSSDDEACAANMSKRPRSAHLTSNSQSSGTSSSAGVAAGTSSSTCTGTRSQQSIDAGGMGDERNRRRELFMQAAERRSATS